MLATAGILFSSIVSYISTASSVVVTSVSSAVGGAVTHLAPQAASCCCAAAEKVCECGLLYYTLYQNMLLNSYSAYVIP